MYILRYRTVPPVYMTLSVSEPDSNRHGVYKGYLTVDSQFSNYHYRTFLLDYDHERGAHNCTGVTHANAQRRKILIHITSISISPSPSTLCGFWLTHIE